jgi:hypothetical protein
MQSDLNSKYRILSGFQTKLSLHILQQIQRHILPKLKRKYCERGQYKNNECRVKQIHYKGRLLFKNIHFHIELMGRGIMYTRGRLPSPGSVVSSAVYTARGG